MLERRFLFKWCRRDTAYNKMSNNFEELKNRFNQVAAEAERLKVICFEV